MRNVATILPLKSKSSGKFHCFNAIDRSIKMLKNFNLNKKNTKNFTRPKQPATLNKLFSLFPTHLHQTKSYCVSGTKIFLRRYTEIYRQEYSSWASKAGAVQMCFLENLFPGKFINSERFSAVLPEHVIPNTKQVQVCKMSEVFWAKLYYKMSDLF